MKKKYLEPEFLFEDMLGDVMVDSVHSSWDDDNWGSSWDPWG